MLYLKNEIKGSTNRFKQSLGGGRHIKLTTMYDDYWLELYGDDDSHILMSSVSEYDFSIAQFVEEMSFKGHYVYISALCVEDWGHKRYHRQRKVYFKDCRTVDFLRDNIVEIFRQGGNEFIESIASERITRSSRFRMGSNSTRCTVPFTMWLRMTPDFLYMMSGL